MDRPSIDPLIAAGVASLAAIVSWIGGFLSIEALDRLAPARPKEMDLRKAAAEQIST